MPNSRSIYQLCRRLVILGAIDIGVGGAVYNDVNSLLLDERQNGLFVSNVQLGNVGEDIFVGLYGTQAAHLAT
jgi:hypothetical protein